jgi:hypothetical protein
MRLFNLLSLFAITLFISTSLSSQGARAESIVDEFEFPNYWYYIDGDLVVLHGLDVPASCNAGDLVLDTWYAKFINIPADEYISVANIKGEDMGTQLYPADLLVFFDDGSLDQNGTCTNFFSNPNLYGYPLAEGTADVVFTGNNVATPDASNPRRSTFHMSAHGFLDTYDSSGAVNGSVLLSGGFNCSYSGDFDPEECNYSIRLH